VHYPGRDEGHYLRDRKALPAPSAVIDHRRRHPRFRHRRPGGGLEAEPEGHAAR
jgi:hypothetical protein